MNWWNNPEVVKRFNSMTPDEAREIMEIDPYHDDKLAVMRYLITSKEICVDTFYAHYWWHQNMGLLDHIVHILFPKLSTFFKDKK